MMRIDAILPTYNRAALLPSALDAALAAHVPAGCTVRIVVVDNNSNDRTRDVVAAYRLGHGDRISYLFEGKQGRHQALNAGIASSTADVVAFFDDDERIAPDWFDIIAGAFGCPDTDYIAGPVRPDWSAPAPSWLPRDGYGGVLGIIDNGAGRRRFNEPGFPAMPTGGNFAIRKSVLDRCGPYAPDFMYAEDRYMYEQLTTIGAVGYYLPALVVFHQVPPKRLRKSYFRHWSYTEGCNRGKLARTKPPEPRSIIGVPAWKWRQVAGAAFAATVGKLRRRRDCPAAFKAELDVIQFMGFVTARNLGTLTDRYMDRA
jgi:glycosyltransferase involved in cell wall biosynthesis